jgi:hypothetical protein
VKLIASHIYTIRGIQAEDRQEAIEEAKRIFRESGIDPSTDTIPLVSLGVIGVDKV